MPSFAMGLWQTNRLPRLAALDGQLAGAPPSVLTDENLRALVAMLSAHFQGFCRDLYDEAALAFATALPGPLSAVAQAQSRAQVALGTGNPNLQNLTRDFDRFGFALKVELDRNPASALRLNHLALMNQWRNYVVHHGTTAPSGPPLDLQMVRTWLASLDELAAELDRIVYDYFQTALGITPW
jgi:hypothetical protein